jgi:ubiquinone/menaquinone biosynthesis C-methylase UbiE
MLNRLDQAKSRVGIDPSSEAVNQANEESSGVEFKVGFAEKLPFADEVFDVAYSLEVIEHVAEYAAMISEMCRVVKPGGYIYIQTPNYPAKRFYDFIYWLFGKRSDLADDYTHVTKLSACRLKKEVGKKFFVENVYSRNIILDSRVRILKGKKIAETLGLFLGQKTIIIAHKLTK